MYVITEEIIINKPPDIVYDFVSQIDKNPLWQQGLLEVQHAGPIEIGTRARTISLHFDKETYVDIEVVDCEPNRRLSFSGHGGPIELSELTYTIEPINGSTCFTWKSRIDVGSFYHLAEPMLEKVSRDKAREDLQTLKALLETMPAKIKPKEKPIA